MINQAVDEVSARKFLFKDDESIDSIMDNSDSGSDGQFPLRKPQNEQSYIPEMEILNES